MAVAPVRPRRPDLAERPAGGLERRADLDLGQRAHARQHRLHLLDAGLGLGAVAHERVDHDLRAGAHVLLELVGAAPERDAQQREEQHEDRRAREQRQEGLRHGEQRQHDDHHDAELDGHDQRAARRVGEVGAAGAGRGQAVLRELGAQAARGAQDAEDEGHRGRERRQKEQPLAQRGRHAEARLEQAHEPQPRERGSR
jgi:hypothetical protein